jgi:hypothetical protein
MATGKRIAGEIRGLALIGTLVGALAIWSRERSQPQKAQKAQRE